MNEIAYDVEINRTAEEVFAYIEQLDRHGEWQAAIIDARQEPAGHPRVGTRNIETRRVPGGPRQIVSEVVEYDPPRRIAARGLNGPIRALVALSVHPLESRCRVTLTIELRGFGIGRALVLFARRAARKQIPRDLAAHKARLES